VFVQHFANFHLHIFSKLKRGVGHGLWCHFLMLAGMDVEAPTTTLMLNPGIACKGTTGTFADVSILKAPSDASSQAWSAGTCCRVDIVQWKAPTRPATT
jgi:hypothetical protein